MKFPACFNFQFSIQNFQSNLNVLKFKFKNSFQISNFKFQIIFLSFIFLFLSSANSVLAQTNPPPSTNPDVPNNMHTYTQSVMVEVMAAMTCQLIGIDPVNPSQKCLGIDSASKKIGFVDTSADSASSLQAGSGQAGGAIGFAGSMIAVLYTPPLHTGDYFSYLAQNFGIAKPAYAATGFEGLSPLIKIWSAFRNIVYLLFVIVFIIIGVAIMLRLHIDPRTVMTIENQIPKIIIGLVMVTFSFAIAGFLIDLMYVSIYTTFGIIKDIPNVGNLGGLDPANLQDVSPMKAVGGLGSPWPGSSGGINGMVNDAALSTSGVIKGMLGLGPLSPIDFVPFLRSLLDLGQLVGINDLIHIQRNSSAVSIAIDLVSDIAGANMVFNFLHIANPTIAGFTIPLSAIPAIPAGIAVSEGTRLVLTELLPWLIAYLVIFIAVLWALFRLWFQLIIAYIYILIDVVFAPFWILAGLFPGSSIGFGAWLRDIVANLSAFPVTIAMFLLGKVFMNAFSSSPIPPAGSFVPPLIGEAGTPGLLGSLIGIGIILMTPQVVTMMRDFLKAPNLKYTAAIGQAVGAGTGVWTGAAGTTGGLITAATFDVTGRKRTIDQEGATGALGGILQRIFRG